MANSESMVENKKATSLFGHIIISCYYLLHLLISNADCNPINVGCANADLQVPFMTASIGQVKVEL